MLKLTPNQALAMKTQINPQLATTQSVYIPLKKIFAPTMKARAWINPERVKEIAISAAAHGILQPILVSPLKNDTYELVYGQHRIEALKYITEHNLDITYSGYFPLDAIKAEIKELSPSERLEIALLENENREDQNPIDKATGILNLIKLELNCDEPYARACVCRLYGKAIGRSVTEVYQPSRLKRIVERNAKVKTSHDKRLTEAELEAVQAILDRFNLEVTHFYNSYLPLLSYCPDVVKAVQLGKIAYSKAGIINQVKDDNYRKGLIEATRVRNFNRESLLKMKQIKDPQNGLALLARIEKEDLSNKQIEAIVHEYLPKKETNPIKTEYTKAIALLKKNNDIWSDRRKMKKLEKIVEEIKKLAVS